MFRIGSLDRVKHMARLSLKLRAKLKRTMQSLMWGNVAAKQRVAHDVNEKLVQSPAIVGSTKRNKETLNSNVSGGNSCRFDPGSGYS